MKRDDKINNAFAFMKWAHGDQMYGDKPYWTHPVAVMNALPDGAHEDVYVAAMLHDVVEDTIVSLDDIVRRFGIDVADMVAALTRPDMDYLDWINNIAASGDIWVIRIKLADNICNLRSRPEMIKRYGRSIAILQEAEKKLMEQGK